MATKIRRLAGNSRLGDVGAVTIVTERTLDMTDTTDRRLHDAIGDARGAATAALQLLDLSNKRRQVPSDMVDHITQALRHLCAADWHAAISDVDYAHITGEG